MVTVTNDSLAPALPEWSEPWEAARGSATATDLFVETFGEAPVGTWSAPGCINLIGEHTDYNRGLSLSAILRHRTYVAGSPRGDRRLRVTSAEGDRFGGPGRTFEIEIDAISPANCEGWPAYVCGVIWALIERGYDGPGLNLAFTSCVPLAAGLGSSAALSCGTARAANGLWRLALDAQEARVDLAESARDAENLVAGTPTGRLDQYAALYGQPDTGLLVDCATSPPTLHETALHFPDYGLALLIVDTRTSHRLTDGWYAQRVKECHDAAAALDAHSLREVADSPDAVSRVERLADETLRKRARHVTTEIHRVRAVVDELASTEPAHERFVAVGRHLNRSHASLARDFEVSSPTLDLAVDAARANGALGARLVGAGFGGAVIALVRRAQIESTAIAIERAFVEEGLQRPRFLRL
jgi:galactokinase